MTHKELVQVAYKWILNNGKVGVAFKELVSSDREIPDVIGFDSCQSILIECKVSRSDFLKDKKKPHREKGMGTWRFYCCPEGLIKKEEIPAQWGLIYVNAKGKARVYHDCRINKIRVECCCDWEKVKFPAGFYYRTEVAWQNRFAADLEAEKRIMYSALRRLFIKGHMKHIYDRDYNRSTTPNELIMLNDTT